MIRECFSLICGGIAAFCVACLGGYDVNIQTLLLMMAADIVFGSALALAGLSPNTDSGFFSSRAFAKGILKRGYVLLIIAVAVRLELMTGVSFLRNTVILAFIVSEGVSIIENSVIVGVPVPKVIVSVLDLLKDEADADRIVSLKKRKQ